MPPPPLPDLSSGRDVPAWDLPAAADRVGAAVELALDLGHRLPLPGQGATGVLWSALADVAAHDLTVARVMEPHLDALAILDQSGVPDLTTVGADHTSTWGVYAAESPHARLTARKVGSGWMLDGEKPWCSLASRLTHAVVTAWTGEKTRRAFAVDLGSPGVTHLPGTWHARGLTEVTSTGLRMADVPAVPVGDDDWYLRRPGFAWGGIGVAAIWYGGAVGVARTLWESARRREPDQVALMHLGAVDRHLVSVGTLLRSTASAVDEGLLDGGAGALAAARVRSSVAATAEDVVTRVGHATGPAPLTGDREHARRVADLSVYLRQHHAERDDVALGRMLLDEGTGW